MVEEPHRDFRSRERSGDQATDDCARRSIRRHVPPPGSTRTRTSGTLVSAGVRWEVTLTLGGWLPPILRLRKLVKAHSGGSSDKFGVLKFFGEHCCEIDGRR